MVVGDCLVWTRAVTWKGYAIVGHNSRRLARVVLAKKLGRPIQKGCQACHTCDEPACVEPSHLYEGTNKENSLDRSVRGRHGLAKLTEDQVREIRFSTEKGIVLSKRYGVDPASISRVRNRKDYQWVQ